MKNKLTVYFQANKLTINSWYRSILATVVLVSGFHSTAVLVLAGKRLSRQKATLPALLHLHSGQVAYPLTTQI